ncbi:MAG: LysR family transcriptional regulator [Clostridiales bacterium]|nr:LysR family transcriptional regulator [Clostridiales bacterium]
MEISYFREFAVLAETKNFRAAADRLFIGQSSAVKRHFRCQAALPKLRFSLRGFAPPCLSKHIKTLEGQLGQPLFVRTSRKVELTPPVR